MSEEFEKRMLERQRAREERRKKWSNLISEEKKQDEVNLSKSEEMKLKMANNLKMGINTLKSMSKEKIIFIASNENLNNINNNKTNGDISHNNNTTNNNTSNNGNISNHNTSPQNNDNIKKLSVKDIQVNNNKSEQKPKVENNIKSNEENNKSDTSGKNLDRRSQRKERLERKIKESLEKEKQEKEQKRLEIMKKYQEQISQRKGLIGIVNNNYNDLLEREKLENERKEKEEEERREKEKKEKERIDQLEKEKREKERKEKERVDLLEKERLEKQKRENEEKERLEKERIEKEKKEKERIDQLEKERSEKERIEKEKKEKERIDQLEKEKREKERKEKEEEVRREKEKKEKERMDQLERERVEKEKKQKEEFERIEKEKKEKERLEKEKKEMEDKQKVTERPLSEREKRELLRKQRREKLQNSSEETEKEEIKKKEMEENERKEKERIEKERLEKEKKEKEDKEKLEKEKELLSKIDKPTKVEQVTKDKPKKKPKKKKPTKMMARSITQIESSNYDFLEEEKKKKPSLKTKKDPLKKLQNLSTTERNVPGVGKPNANKLSLKQLFPNGTGSPPDLEALKEHFRSEGRLEMDAAYEILKQCQPILKKEPNMLNLKTPVKIIGDIHGQYYDLLFLLSKAGDVKNNQYLFMGDYVDRGYFSCEVFLYLAALKITYKENIFLLRGNHESRMCTKNYSFMTECFYKYDEDLYNEFMLTFDNLPLAALLTNKSNDKFLCVHGGISAAIRDFISIEEIYRFGEIPDKGELCDLVWADPMRQEEEMDLEEFRDLRYEINKVRGISYQFGYSALNEFLEMNEICSIIRAHEVQKDGYEELWYGFKKGDVNDIDNGIRKFPPLITVFSAPNYCDFYHNYGGFLQMNDNDLNFVKLKWTEHPYRLPNFLNAVSFSLPLVYENIEKIFLSLFKVESKDNDLKNIVNSITKWDESVKQVREQRKAFLEQISQFQNTPEEETFEKAQDFDQVLEHRHPTKRPVMRRTATSFW